MTKKLAVFPAPAGMNRNRVRRCIRVVRVPRASGDEPRLLTNFLSIAKCSPRQRG